MLYVDTPIRLDPNEHVRVKVSVRFNPHLPRKCVEHMRYKPQIQARGRLLTVDSPVGVIKGVGENCDGGFAMRRLLASSLLERMGEPIGARRTGYRGHVRLIRNGDGERQRVRSNRFLSCTSKTYEARRRSQTHISSRGNHIGGESYGQTIWPADPMHQKVSRPNLSA